MHTASLADGASMYGDVLPIAVSQAEVRPLLTVSSHLCIFIIHRCNLYINLIVLPVETFAYLIKMPCSVWMILVGCRHRRRAYRSSPSPIVPVISVDRCLCLLYPYHFFSVSSPSVWLLVYLVDSLSTKLTPCLPSWLPVYQVDSLSTKLTPCLPSWLPVYLLTPCLPSWLPVYQVDSLSTSLTPCLPSWLPVYLLTPCLPSWLPVCQVDSLSTKLTPCLPSWHPVYLVDSLSN